MDSSGQIVAVDNTGHPTLLNITPSPPTPESVAIVPTVKCPYAPTTSALGSSPVYFAVDNTNNTLDFLPFSMFAGGQEAGKALITSEGGGGVTKLTTDPKTNKLVTSQFAAPRSAGAKLQGSAFVNCNIPLLLSFFRDDVNINPNASGVVTVWILQKANFNPLTICVGGRTADGSKACPAPLNHVPTFGFTGTEGSFNSCKSNLVTTTQGPALICKFNKNQLGIKQNGYTGPLVLKLFYIGAGGDPDAEGGG
jgi:hypothetical protein